MSGLKKTKIKSFSKSAQNFINLKGEKMSFNNVAKISFIVALAIGANAAENVTLSGVEVTGTGGVRTRLMK